MAGAWSRSAVVSTDHLLVELWGDAPPASADNSIHVYISRLRKELGADRLITRPPGYALRVEPSELDLFGLDDDLYTIRADGTHPKQRTVRPGFDNHADWQPLPNDARAEEDDD